MSAALVCVYVEREDWIRYNAVIYRPYVTLKVRLNDMLVGFTELGKTQKKSFF